MSSEILPPNWSWAKLGDVAKLIRGVSYKKDMASKSSKPDYLPIVRANNINSSLHFDDLVYVPNKLIKEEQFIKAGDIVIAMSSGSKDLVGKAAQAQSDTKIAFGTFCGLVRFSSDKVNNKFFGFYFHSKTYRDHISKVSMGVNINNLRKEHIEELDLPLPPLPEQKKIVEKIEELFSGLDSGVASLKKAKAQIRLYRQSVLASAFSGRLTQSAGRQAHSELKAAEPKVNYSNQLPDGWKWVKLGEIAKVKGGKRVPKGESYSEVETKYPYIRVVDFENMSVRIDELKYLKYETQKKIKNYYISKNDLYISIAGTIGRVGLIPEKLDGANLTENAAKITEVKNYSLKFLSYLMNSFLVQNQIKSLTISTTQPKLALFRIEKLDLIQPPINQQHQIVSEIEKRFSEADNLEKAIDESLEKSDKLRQSILKQAFEGKLV